MGLSYRASRILDRLHKAIRAQGQRGLDEFRTRLHELCLDGTQLATESNFAAAAAAGGDGVLSLEEAGILFKELCGGSSVVGNDQKCVPFAKILRALRSPTSRQRVALARAVFDMIDQDRDGLLSYDEVLACYQAANHPDVRRGVKSSAEVQQDFLQTLSDVTSAGLYSIGGMLSFPAFLDFYCSLTAFTSDEDFRDAIVVVWTPPVARDVALHTLGGAGGLVANLRSQILARGLPGVSAFCRGVRDATVVGIGNVREIDQEAFRSAAGAAGAELTSDEMNQAFRHLDRRGAGHVPVADALRAVRGVINKRRELAANEVFDSLLFGDGGGGGGGGGEGNDNECQTLEPAVLAQLYRAEAHPDVVSGARTQQAVFKEFLEAFEGGGHVAGRITRAEWQEHSSNVSALIADDSSFCEHIQRMWGYDDGRSGSGDPSCNKVDPGGNSRNGTPIKPDAGYSSWGVEGKGDSPVCRGGNNDPSGKNHGSATGSTGPSCPPPPCVRFPRKAWGPQPAGEPNPTPFLGQQSATDTEVAVTTPAGILGLLGRARDSLVAGGLRGAFRLLKGFRGEDRGGSGKVTLSGFKAVLGKAELGLEEAEMRILFQYFDREGDGEVPYELFLRSIRAAMPNRRLALAHQAFDRMDPDGDGLVFVEDIADAFKAGAHPEVLEGSREEDDVRREFLESFAVADGSRERCTRDDVIRWMELVSSSMPTPAADSRFENLLRGCWGIGRDGHGSGDRGKRADGSLDEGTDSCLGGRSINVVVTHASGKISVEAVSLDSESVRGGSSEGADDVLLSKAQAQNIRQQLASKGVQAVHVRLLGTGTPSGASSRAGTTTRLAQDRNASHGSSLPPHRSGHPPSADDIRVARLGPLGDGCGSGGVGGCGEGFSAGLDHGLRSVLDAARKRLALRGPVGFFSLSRRLRSLGYFRSAACSTSRLAVVATGGATNGYNGNGNSKESGPYISVGGFKEALAEIGCGLTDRDLSNIFVRLDDGGRGEIPVEVALEAIRGRLTDPRLSLVRTVFSRLRGGGDAPAEAATAGDVVFQFDPKGHPDAIASRRSPEEVQKEFMDAMTTTEGLVTWKDFESYYADVSAATPSDAYFSLQLQSCWGLGPAAAASAISAATARKAVAGATARLRGDYDPTTTRRTYSKARTSAPPGVLPGTAEFGNKEAVVTAIGGGARARDRARVPTAGIGAILRKLGAEIRGQGAAWGLAGLRRALLDGDRNNDGFLSLREFKVALSSSRAGLTASEVRALFIHLETGGSGGGDASGIASWRALLDAIRSPLGGERLGLVRLAFAKMDTRGEGSVSAEAIVQRFVASRHPAVLRGHATVDEVRKELLDTFLSEGAGEGRVTEEDFVEHHANLSFGLPAARDFYELVINCWGLDGCGDGALFENAAAFDYTCGSHRRFLVTYADGSQSVEELPFSSEDRESGDAESPLTTAEEQALKRDILKRDNAHATQVALLQQQSPDSHTDTAPRATTSSPPPVASGNPVIDRRPAWAWAPMSLSEIHASAVIAAGNKPTHADEMRHGNDADQGGSNSASAEKRASLDKEEEEEEEEEEEGGGGAAAVVHAGRVEGREGVWDGEEGDGGGAGGRARQRMRAGGRRKQAGQWREADLSVRYLLTKLRAELNSRGAAGMSKLAQRLRGATASFGTTGSCRGVGAADFRQAMRETELPFTEADVRRIFAHFELGKSGVMNPDAFMNRLSGCMNSRRAVLVDEAFDRLDTAGKGYLALEEIIDAFDATRHPEVLSRRRAPDAIFRDFVEGFTAGFPEDREIGAKATKEDFRRYYDLVSATVPDNGYFRLLLRSCWRMPVSAGLISVNQRGVSVAHGAHHHQGYKRPSGQARNGRYGEEATTTAGPTTAGSGGQHGSSRPGVVPPPSEGRESSFESLREGRAAGSRVGRRSCSRPSEENRKLRGAILSRTFDSQISFGTEGDGEVMRDRGPVDAAEIDDGAPRPAGGGKGARIAEGAAWTPGGRRLIPGSKAFVSHLGNGMRVTRGQDGGSVSDRWSPASFENNTTADGGGRAVLGLAKGRKGHSVSFEEECRAAAAAREPPIWIPQKPHKSTHVTAGGYIGGGGGHGYLSADAGMESKHGGLKAPARSSSDHHVSLAQLVEGSPLFNGDDAAHWQEKDDARSDYAEPPSAGLARPAGRKNAVSFERDNEFSREKREGERFPKRGFEQSARVRAGGAFDWWGGGGGVLGENDALGGEEGAGIRGTAMMQPRSVSDTYKSNLIFG